MRKNVQNLEANEEANTISSSDDSNTSCHQPQSSCPSKSQRVESTEIDISSLERDLGLHRQIWEYSPDHHDEVGHAYIKAGPYQHILPNCPLSGSERHLRRFQCTWLEYSPRKDVAFCFLCFLFNKLPPAHFGASAFTI